MGAAQVEKTLKWGLKEWNVAVSALAAGNSIVLLRKGGIREEKGRFSVEQNRVVLFPTFEHQKPELLKSEYSDRVQTVASGWHPQSIEIGAWANITHVEQVTETEPLQRLLPLHIWNERFAVERFRWKPKQPLYVLLLRVYRLPQAVVLPFVEAYAGCRSWVELGEEIGWEGSEAVLTDEDYGDRVSTVLTALND